MKIENEITLREIIILLRSLSATVNEEEVEEGKEGKEAKEGKKVEKGSDAKIEDKEKKTEKNDEIVPMSTLVDRYLNYESRDTDDVTQKNEENNTKIQKKNDLFDEFLEFKEDNLEKNENSDKKKNAKNIKSVSEFENFFSVTNGSKRDRKINGMTHDNSSVLAGDVSEVDEVEVEVEDAEAEVLEAFRHAAAIPFTESSDVEDEDENKTENEDKKENEGKEVKERKDDQSESGNDNVKGIKGAFERKEDLPVHYSDVDFADKSSIHSSGWSADQSSAPAALGVAAAVAAAGMAVVHYHVASPTRSPSQSPFRSPSSPSFPTRHSHHKKIASHSNAEVQSLVDNDTVGGKIGLNDIDIFKDKNGEIEGNVGLISDADDVEKEIADDGVLKVNDKGVVGELRDNVGAECDQNESKLCVEMMVNYGIDDKLNNFDFDNASDNDENIELDGEIRDFDEKNPLESLLNLRERHLIQEKLHAKQQGNIKNQQLELLKLKKVVAIKLKEKETENENLKNLRNELLLKNQIKMDLPANFGESNLSELKLSHLSIGDNNSEIDGTSEMKELSSLTTPYLNPSRNNIYNVINRKNSASSDSQNSDNRDKNAYNNNNNNNNNNNKQIITKNTTPNADNIRKREIKSFKNNIKNIKSKNIPENVLDDPYDKLLFFRQERSSRTELPLEYLSPKERSIRKKKMEADRLMTSAKAENVSPNQNQNQNQDIPIADHIKV